MKQGTIILNDKFFRREVEMLGDVEKVRWYEYKEDSDTHSEIYDQQELDTLELALEDSVINTLTPVPSII